MQKKNTPKKIPPREIALTSFHNAAWHIKTNGGDRNTYLAVTRPENPQAVSDKEIEIVRGFFERQASITIIPEVTMDEFCAASALLQNRTTYHDNPAVFDIACVI